jgi:hypothetical protein
LTKWPIGRYSDKVSALYPDYSHVFSSTDLIKMGHIQKMKILKYDFFQLIIWYFMSGVKINNAQPSFISQRILKMFFFTFVTFNWQYINIRLIFFLLQFINQGHYAINFYLCSWLQDATKV